MRGRRWVGVLGSMALLGAAASISVPVTSSGAGVAQIGVLFEEDGVYTVPADVCVVTITARAGAGGDGEAGSSSGGAGGVIRATFPVDPGAELDVFVGKRGTHEVESGTPRAGGDGFDVGGDGRTSGGGGGGSSAVVDAGHILIVAGGGGGGGEDADGGAGGVGGLGSGGGQSGSGLNFGVGGVDGDPNLFADAGGDATSGGGGGAGSRPGNGATDDDGSGGGGGSAVSERALGLPSDPGSPPDGDGEVLIAADPGIGCPPVLEVAKVVSGPSTEGFTVHVVCTREARVPDEIESAALETTVDADLPYTADGAPEAGGPSGWIVADGVWQHAAEDLTDSTCTATETGTGGALSVAYACAWAAGAEDHRTGVGCPGEEAGPSSTPLSVTFEGNGDAGRLTVTNTFAAQLEPTFTG